MVKHFTFNSNYHSIYNSLCLGLGLGVSKCAFASYDVVFVIVHSNQLMEDKRRLENRISQLEEDLEEEQMNYETANEKSRKAIQQVMKLANVNDVIDDNTSTG